MPSKVYSGALIGIECERVEVECDAGSGQFCFIIVGLPDMAVQESRERIRAALKNSGLPFPRGRVTVNLAPADVRKEGPAYDLPIALSILCADGEIVASFSDQGRVFAETSLFAGELSLDGDVRPVRGILPLALLAKQLGIDTLFVAEENADEASLTECLSVYGIRSLRELIEFFQGKRELACHQRSDEVHKESEKEHIDFSHIRGQEHAKRALEIAAAGAHNILFSGPPGSGKTLLARSLQSILPQLTLNESLEVTAIHSAAGLLSRQQPFVNSRPFRSPHHTASTASLVGGGSIPRPGEMSLAHRGVLFMDEFPEFSRSSLEALRQPLEDGHVTVSRSSGTVRFPAQCMLVAAQNPCPCGNYGKETTQCTCTASAIAHYQKKVSGPLMDRIDLFVDVPRVSYDHLSASSYSEQSSVVRERVAQARSIQKQRFASNTYTTNAEMRSIDIDRWCTLENDARNLLGKAVGQLSLSARSYYRILKIARTIADLEGSSCVALSHVAESLQYRHKPLI
ncbi:MAG: YifB family Mg chelatase-like AAA ATPase [Patescibacteria group bacterium]